MPEAEEGVGVGGGGDVGLFTYSRTGLSMCKICASPELLYFLCKGPNQHSVTERSCTMPHNGKFLHINGLIQKGLQAAGAIRSRK